MSHIKTIKKILVILAVGVLMLLPSSLAYAAAPTCQDGSTPNAKGLCPDGNCPDGSAPDTGGNCTTHSTDDVSCGFGAWDWALCPVIQIARTATQVMDNFITSTLDIDVKQIFDTGSGATAQNDYYTAWNTFRILAIGLLLIGGLIMIIAQAVGMEFLDAYTIRKVLPRLLIAIIGITLSWQLMRFVINFFDVLGFDVRALIYAPFKNVNGGIVSLSTAIFSTALVGIVAFAGFAPAALTFILGGFVAAFFGFLVLVFRQIAIILIIIVAPVAIACYILPNTQRAWKLWYDNFMALMLMFPIASAFIAASHAFSAIALSGGGTTSEIIGIVAYFLPYFMLVKIFTMSKGLMGTVAGIASRAQAGGLRRVQGIRANSAKKAWSNIQDGKRFRGGTEDNRRGRINKQLQKGSFLSKDQLVWGGVRSNLAALNAGTKAAASAHDLQKIAKAAELSAAFSAFKGNDDVLEASLRFAASGNIADARAHLVEKGYTGDNLERHLGLIRQARTDLGSKNFAVASAISNAGTGTGNPEGAGQLLDSILKASGGDMTVATAAYAEARGKADQARRYDLTGGGFGQGLRLMTSIATAQGDTARAAAIKKANDEAADMALDNQGVGAIVNSRGESARNLGPAMKRRLEASEALLEEAKANGGKIERGGKEISVEELEREFIQNVAFTSAAIDYAGSAAPQVARLYADSVYEEDLDIAKLPDHIRTIIARNPDGGHTTEETMTYSEVMKRLEVNAPEIYGQVKKLYTNEFSRRTDEDAQRRTGGSPIGPTP